MSSVLRDDGLEVLRSLVAPGVVRDPAETSRLMHPCVVIFTSSSVEGSDTGGNPGRS